MPKVKLNNTFLAKVTPPTDKLKVDYFDTEVIGLMLEVRKSANMTFYYRYNKEGKTILHKLSSTEHMDVDEARRLSLKMKKAIATDSLDTMFIKKNKTLTLIKFYEEHYLPYVKVHSNSWKKNESTYRLHILPTLGNYPMDEITSPIISKLHIEAVTLKKLANGTVNKIIVFLRHAYNIALEMKIEGVTENPAKRVKQFEELNREMYITKAETKKLMKAVTESKNPHLKYIIPFLILTGARRSEVLRAKWRDIDYERNIWTIPITKNKRIRKIPMSESLQELIKSIPATSEFLFPAPIKAGHYTDINRPWHHARAKAGLNTLRLHDLRHSFASQLVNSGRSLYEVQILLGHTDMKMTQRYAHLSNDSLLAAASCAGKLLK